MLDIFSRYLILSIYHLPGFFFTDDFLEVDLDVVSFPFFFLYFKLHLTPQALHKVPFPCGPLLHIGVSDVPQNSQVLFFFFEEVAVVAVALVVLTFLSVLLDLLRFFWFLSTKTVRRLIFTRMKNRIKVAKVSQCVFTCTRLLLRVQKGVQDLNNQIGGL